MDYHHHARLTVHGRAWPAREVLEGRRSLREAAAERKLNRQTAAKAEIRISEIQTRLIQHDKL